MQRLVLIAALVAAAVSTTSCGEQRAKARDEAAHAHKHKDEHNDEIGASFSAKSGLFVPEETAQFIGLEVKDVEERKVTSNAEFTAKVYDAPSEARLATGRSAVRASGSVRSAVADQLKVGQAIDIEIEGHKCSGRIVELKHELEKTTGFVEALLEIFDVKERHEIGSHVSVTVPNGSEKTVVSIPRSALLQTAEGNFVYTVSGNRFVRTTIKIGARNDKFVEVVDGLYAGDQVVVKPVMTLWLAELQAIRGGKACADGH